jgi:hypothetical protein
MVGAANRKDLRASDDLILGTTSKFLSSDRRARTGMYGLTNLQDKKAPGTVKF